MGRSRHVSVDLPARAADPRARLRTLSDVVLCARARAGERAALAALLERHHAGAHRHAARILADPEDARDAAQEALARVVDRLRTFRAESSFATWLHALVESACADEGRRLGRRRRRELPADDGDRAIAARPAPDRVDELALARAARGELAAELALLSRPQRRVLLMRDVVSLRYGDIAALLELPVGTVRTHAHRGRRLLAERLARPA
jgi:RNA polymerase sigma-70 factor (ECF subfamily)